MTELAERTTQLLAAFEQRGLYLAVAESLTGGALTAQLTSISGSSNVILGGVVAYQASLKRELLGVSGDLLQANGSVDPQVALQMAAGVRARLASAAGIDRALVVGVATTGVAGPDSQDGKPVGTVFIAISAKSEPDETQPVSAHLLAGTRAEIQSQTVEMTIDRLWEHFSNV